MSEDKNIVLCKECSHPEYWGEIHWLSGRCMCRDCYRKQYEDETGKLYAWKDLDGKRPSIEEYNQQEAAKDVH